MQRQIFAYFQTHFRPRELPFGVSPSLTSSFPIFDPSIPFYFSYFFSFDSKLHVIVIIFQFDVSFGVNNNHEYFRMPTKNAFVMNILGLSICTILFLEFNLLCWIFDISLILNYFVHDVLAIMHLLKGHIFSSIIKSVQTVDKL